MDARTLLCRSLHVAGAIVRTRLRSIGTASVLTIVLFTGTFAPFSSAGFGIQPSVANAAALNATGGKPNHFDPKSGTKSVTHLPATANLPAFTPEHARPPMTQGFTPSMKQGLLVLDPAKDTQFRGSDGRLEVDVPAGAVTTSDVAAAGGKLAVRLTEIAPASGSNAGGSSVISLGSYLLEVVDGQGNRITHGLRKAAVLKLHYGNKASALDLDQAFVVFNGAHPVAITGLGAYSTQTVAHDRTQHILQAQLPIDGALAASPTATAGLTQQSSRVLGLAMLPTTLLAAQSTPSTTFTFNTYAPVAKFGSPDPLDVDLNAGSLTQGLQLDVPPGPAGAMPNITLAYNSAAVSEQHSPQGAAGWVGEGWSLSLGSISWAEHNVHPTCTNCGNTWQNNWQLTDPFGTSTELIPPNITTSTYYDDTPNWYCATGNATSTACPIQFHTARETHARVYAYVGPNALGTMPQNPPCFRVYLANGVMEEFGCTPDALQYYPIQAGTLPGQTNQNLYYPVNWLLDLITNPQGDQIHITYQSDTETAPDGLTYPRDTAMATIEWDSPNCVNASQRCTGSAAPNQWQPLYRVNFVASHHTVTRLTNTPANCNPDSSVRCDDPTNVSHGIAAPLVNGTFVLNDIQVQTNPTADGISYSSTSWNTVRDYQLSYEQSGPTTITDPATGKQLSAAGYLDLTQLKEVGDNGTTAAPATTFSYTSQTEYYEDGSYTPYRTTFCGPSWNTGGNGGTCDLWSQTRDGNSRYISSISNGQGLQETLTWANARSNTHGVNSGVGSDIANPLYCNSHQTGYPCNSADDQAWSRSVVTQRSDAVVQVTQAGQGGQQTSTPVTSTSAYTYQLSYPLLAQECLDCVAGMYWGNQNDGDYLDYYNGHFMGFAQTSVSNPDGSVVVHKYEATEGWGVYDTNQGISCAGSSLPPITTTCHAAPWWHLANAGHGLQYEADYYDTNGTTLLKKVTTQYQAVCPPSGVSGTPSDPTYGTWDGNLVSGLDHNNPVAACDLQQTQQVTTTYNGTGNSITDTEASTYDSFGRETQTTSTSNSGGGSGSSASPTQIIHKTSYVWNDGLTVPAAQRSNASQEAAWGGAYLITATASTDTEDGSGTQYTCQRTSYDGQAYTTGQTSTLTQANTTKQDGYANACGANPSGALSTTAAYDGYGNQVSGKDPEANTGNTSHLGAAGTACANVTACVQYDATNHAKPTLASNDANQNTTTAYNAATDPAGGFGLWQTSMADPSGGVTTSTYDALGRKTSQRSPGQSSGPATQSTTYANWCAGTSAQSPCVEVDTTQRVNSTTTITTRKFYDGAGRLVETRTAAPGSQDTVQYTLYNVAGQTSTQSVSYFVTAYTGAAGSAAYSIPDSTQLATTTTYDGLGRTLRETGPLSNVTQTAYSIVCSAPGTGSDTGCYEQTLTTDANNHEQGMLADGFGRQVYAQRYTGNSQGTYALYSTTKNTYDFNRNLTRVLHPDGTHVTISTYDTAGRLLTLSDPDRGVASYSYDANGNLTQQIDARCGTTLPQTPCSAGTIYTGYDGLNRAIWRNTTSSPTGAYATYAYDEANHGASIGYLTTEQFNGGPGSGNLGAGSYSYSYDALGNKTSWGVTLGGTTYTFGYGYNDASMPTSTTYSDGEVASYGYDTASGWLTSLVTTPSGGTATNLLTGISYSGAGAAGGLPTGASVANGVYTYSASYDADLRPTNSQLVLNSLQSVLFKSSRTYDAVGNVTGVTTTLAAGTDTQAFCYDEQNRLTWASSASGTIPCGGTNTAGSLTAAQYSASYGYDTLDRLTSGPTGSYTYGDSAHLHAVTAIGSSYGATYDAAGNMTCRAPTGSTTCTGTPPTGAQLTYDNEGRLTAWQNAPSNPTSTEAMAYDGEGNRVALKVNGGTPTYYLGTLEEIAGSTLTKYFCAPSQANGTGLPTAVRVGTGGAISYLASDGLGSLNEALDASGNVTFQQLYLPYGAIRYTNGTAPTTQFFTGQRWDSTDGIYYYNARYYDPSAQQFASADTVADGLNRYGYVAGNPETATDPTGHWMACMYWGWPFYNTPCLNAYRWYLFTTWNRTSFWDFGVHVNSDLAKDVAKAYAIGGGFLVAIIGIFCGLLAWATGPAGPFVGAICAFLDAVFAATIAFYAIFIPYWNEQCGYRGVWLNVRAWRWWWAWWYVPYWYNWTRAC